MTPVDSRRTYLRAVGASSLLALAGCLGDAPFADTPTPLVTTDDLAFRVAVVEQFTDEHPAQLLVQLENTASAPLLVVGAPELPFPAAGGSHRTRDAWLRLLPYGTRHIRRASGERPLVPTRPVDGCWRLEADLVRYAVGDAAHLEPGDSSQTAYALLDGRGDGCLPPGEYRFGSSVTIEPGTTDAEQQDEAVVSLGFALALDDDARVSVTSQDLAT